MSPHLEQAFLDDIVAHPEDPSLWLILADWLDEREDPRGELVRLSWQLRHEPKHKEFVARQTRVQALLYAGVTPVVPSRTEREFEFVWIPPGTFRMGSPADEVEHRTDEKLRRITFKAGFWLGRYQVTQTQYERITGTNPSSFNHTGTQRDRVQKVSDADLANYPIDNVSWHDAQEFCQRLGDSFRLPTEPEWEYACRAGTRTPFWFGVALNGTQANADGNIPYGCDEKGPYLRHPVPVGSYPPNPFGLYDMHGNLWEWCEDLHDRKARDTGDERSIRVVRGGSWDSYTRNVRAAYRNDFSADTRNNVIGMRLVRVCR